MADVATPRTPKGLGAAGRRLWRSVVDEFELTEAESLLLLQAARAADRLEVLADALQGAELTVTTVRGDTGISPLLAESRAQSLLLARLLSTLRNSTAISESRPSSLKGLSTATFDTDRTRATSVRSSTQRSSSPSQTRSIPSGLEGRRRGETHGRQMQPVPPVEQEPLFVERRDESVHLDPPEVIAERRSCHADRVTCRCSHRPAGIGSRCSA